MRKILASGYYGMSNFGDDLFVLSVVEGAKKFWPGVKLSVCAPPIREVPANYVLPRRLEKIFQSRSLVGSGARFATHAVNSIRSDGTAYCGGSIFTGRKASVRKITSSLKRGDLVATGVSVGPFKSANAEKRAQEELKRFDYISLRDRLSFDLVSSFVFDVDVVLAGDLATTLDLESLAKDRQERDVTRRTRVGFAPCSGPDANWRNQQVQGFCELASSFHEGYEVRLLSLNGNQSPNIGDDYLCAALLSALPNCFRDVQVARYSSSSVFEIIDQIASLDILVTSRLHGAIVAYALGVPFVLWSQHPKCKAFCQDIGALSRLVSPGSSVIDIFRAVESGGLGEPSMHQNSYSERAKANFTNVPLAWREL